MYQYCIYINVAELEPEQEPETYHFATIRTETGTVIRL
jgi:hypothetical protein